MKTLESEWYQTSPHKSYGKAEGSAVTSSPLGDKKQVEKGQQAPERVPDDMDRRSGDTYRNGRA